MPRPFHALHSSDCAGGTSFIHRRVPLRTPLYTFLPHAWVKHTSIVILSRALCGEGSQPLRLVSIEKPEGGGLPFARVDYSVYGGKLKLLSFGEIHNVTTRVFALFSASVSGGNGAYGLTATFTSTESLLLGALAPMTA